MSENPVSHDAAQILAAAVNELNSKTSGNVLKIHAFYRIFLTLP